MMRVVYLGFPARSHTVPSLALVKELVKRGARVEYHSTEPFRPLIELAGARFAPYGTAGDGLSDPVGLEGPGRIAVHAQRLVDAARRLVPDLMTSLGRPDLLVSDASAYWGGLICRRLGKPWAAFISTFSFTRTMLRLLGVDDSSALDVLVPAADLKIVCTSRFFQPSGRFFDDSHVFVGPLLDQRPQEGIRIWPKGPGPIAYVSLGTIFNRDRKLLARIAGKLSAAGWQVVASLGIATNQNGYNWPAAVDAYPFVNQMAALALADVAVTHGGLASISEIVAHRVPAIAVPQAADQFLVARRAASLGAAVVVDYGADFSEAWDTAIAAVRENHSAMAAAAGRIAQSFSEVTPMAVAADRLFQLAMTNSTHAGHD
jgi:UDP:flavonoid glycosyltransferase YjiC (YdhE family)